MSQNVITNETLRNRVLTREGGGRGTLTKCAARYRDFSHKLLSSSPSSSSEIDEAKQLLKRELMLYSLEMRKLILVAESAESELGEYDAAQIRIEESISKSREDIEALKRQLVQEKKVRRDKEEYEALAKLANMRPSKRETEKKLADLQRDMNAIQTEEVQSAKELEVREKQFQLLLQSIFDLKSTLVEDEEEDDFCRNKMEGDNEQDDPKSNVINEGGAGIEEMDTST